MRIRSCTCSSNLTDFLPIRQEFVFFTRGGQEGLSYPGWEIVHVRCSSIFEKWGATIVKLLFGGCFTKHPVFGTRKMENGFLVRRKGKLPWATLFAMPRCTCVHNMAHYHKLCHRCGHNIGHLPWKPWNFVCDSSVWEQFFKIFAIFQVCYFSW